MAVHVVFVVVTETGFPLNSSNPSILNVNFYYRSLKYVVGLTSQHDITPSVLGFDL
jgi:hypothetical protein